MKCKNCGNEVTKDMMFCGECGSKVVFDNMDTLNCAVCDSPIKESDEFCGE
jgi:DNA-directed RNA polymerase subunit RPC12/RpoP